MVRRLAVRPPGNSLRRNVQSLGSIRRHLRARQRNRRAAYGASQLGPSGDRLIVPAGLFLSGKAGHLVASGLNVTDIGGSRSLADDTAALWRELGIPESSITRLSEPRTTKEEIRDYKKLMESRSWKRVGVCSSAWHLRRVEKICRDEGITMTPVPADFLSSPLPWIPMFAVPQARGFQNVQKAAWEYLGALTGG